MNLISGRQVLCPCNGQNKTVPWQEYIDPAIEQFLSCPKAKICFFPVIDPGKIPACTLKPKFYVSVQKSAW